MRRLLVASEYGEPSLYQDTLVSRLRSTCRTRDVCLLLITKELPKCERLVETAQVLGVPMQIHCTMTGLGGTSWEPHMHAPSLIVDSCLQLMKEYELSPESVTLRIDPIVNEALGVQMGEATIFVKAFAEFGVRDCILSVLDYYPHVRARMSRYKFDVEPCRTFQIAKPRRDELISFFYHLCSGFGVRVHLCAEQIPTWMVEQRVKGIDVEGCASRASWERLGIDDLMSITRRQRGSCTCDLDKLDLLRGLNKGCEDGCMYCYWRRDGE